MERKDFDELPDEEPLRRLWEALDRLPEEQPSPALRQRFYRMLASEMENVASRRQARGRWRAALAALLPRPARLGLAWALPALLVGILLGSRTPAAERGREIGELQREVRSLSRLVTLSLLEQESASERLKGVSYGRSTGADDERVLGALLDAVAHDPNVNVRLAAIEALGDVAARPRVQRTLVESLRRQESPMVQLALVDLLVEAPGARPLLARATADPRIDPSVRDYLRRRLERQV